MILKEEDFPRRLLGRIITRDDLMLFRQIIAQNPSDLRQHISRKVCLELDWYKPDGGLKDMSARLLLLKLHQSGLIQLPPPQSVNNNNRKSPRRTPAGEPACPIEEPLSNLMPLKLQRVTSKTDSALWNELIDRYHYLGYAKLVGAQIRYLVHSQFGPVAAFAFSAAAWKAKPRDAWIGWTQEQRNHHLQLVVNNSRFLILPWVNVKNLASKLLSMVAQQLPDDWQSSYGYTPVLMETFVDIDRFKGTCYRAANWIHVGCTQGRGRYDRLHENKVSVKDMYLFPLKKNFRCALME